MALVSVCAKKEVKGWDAPGTPGAYRCMKVMELRKALEEEYDCDAYMTMYAVEGQEKIHRVNQAGWSLYPHPLHVTVFCADYDNPGKKSNHEPWPPGEEEPRVRGLVDTWRKAEILRGAIFHSTLKGIHIIQPLLVPIPIASALPYFRWWLCKIREAGVEYDKAIEKEVGRLWRLANVRREHAGQLIDYKPSVMLLDDVQPLALPQLSEDELRAFGGARESPKGVRVVRAKLAEVQLPDAGEPWCYRAKMIAVAAKKELDKWHRMFMFISGALLDKGAPPSRLAAICAAISIETGADDKREDRVQSAKSTIERVRRGQSVGGYAGLLREWRHVALAVEESLAIHTQADYERWAAGALAPQLPTGAEVSAQLRESMRSDGDGPTMYHVPPGTGKSAAATDVAAELAADVVRSATGRAPRGTKSAFSVDKHELAKQYQDEFAKRGIEVKRLFNPLTVLRDDGEPECIHHRTAAHLIAAPLSIHWELCLGRNTDPCERFAVCRARLGFEGPEDALITIGTHARIEKLAEDAGASGTLYVDEPPSVFEKTTITPEQLKLATEALRDFGTRFECGMRPALQAIAAWFHCEIQDQPRDPVEVVRQYASQVDPADIGFAKAQTGLNTADPVDLARAALDPAEQRGRSQLPLRSVSRHLAVHNIQHAARIGAAGRILGVLHQALTSELPGAGMWQEGLDGKAVIVLYLPREPYIRALQRQGRTIILDANAASSRPMLTPFLGFEPALRTYEVADGAEIERTWRMTLRANRSGWFEGECPTFNDSLVHAIHSALHWADNLGLDKSLGIITMQAIEIALRLALDPDDSKARRKWDELGFSRELLARVQTEFGPPLRARSGAILWGHYGAIKGLNHMAGVDLLVTLGDPWQNVMCIEHETNFAKLDKTARARGEEACQNELQQAHGRLRTVHRTRPGWALHVGAVRPGGSVWAHNVRDLAVGRPANVRAITPEQIKVAIGRLRGTAITAKYLGCAERTLRRYASGERTPDGPVLDDLIGLATWRAA